LGNFFSIILALLTSKKTELAEKLLDYIVIKTRFSSGYGDEPYESRSI
jgi:hypothetical protein